MFSLENAKKRTMQQGIIHFIHPLRLVKSNKTTSNTIVLIFSTFTILITEKFPTKRFLNHTALDRQFGMMDLKNLTQINVVDYNNHSLFHTIHKNLILPT